MERKRAGLVGLLLAGAMVFGMTACGGGSDKEESSKAASSASASESDDRSSSSGDSSSASLDDFLDSDCQDAVAAYVSIFTSAFGGSSMLSDEDKKELEDNLDQLEGKVPAALEDDIETISSAFKEYFEALGDLDLASLANPANAGKLEEATKKIDSSSVKKAQENVEEFFEEKCPAVGGSFSS